ncbi:phosphate acetyltransferase [Kineosphaera limosa]|uniref:Phosphate acetyltransferase n=1 Tax=Kineosphaera limosa NBRC 100340 TaxID=1184609 RepID=K6XGE3_9MICO|nr:phosphate acetyltransferase [Kineosphaera limosa]NYD99797.1 phosphate acetyltransferase [Kineosphaera limosa]GAB97889.1 phosphate acetyltransferase [Kineosphaera limosa NBRC 100340]
MSSRGTPNLYLASPDPRSGKSAVAVGLLEEKQRAFDRVGVFRPIVRSDGVEDDVLRMLLDHLPQGQLAYADAFGVTYDDVLADPQEAMGRIVQRFHRLAGRCDVVLVVGSDYTDVAGPMEFGFNTQIAANLAAPIVLVVSGRDRRPADIARAGLSAINDARLHHAEVRAVIANRVAPEDAAAVESALADALRGPARATFVIPEDPVLSAPSVGVLATAVRGRQLLGSPESLEAEALDVVVGADQLRAVLEQLRPGTCVLVPHDRLDLLLGVTLSQTLPTFPRLAAVFVAGTYSLEGRVEAALSTALRAAGVDLPVIAVPESTTAALRGLLGVGSGSAGFTARKLDTARELFDRHVDTAALVADSAAAVATAMTPLMFEHSLVERARAADRHIVLPEGTEDRIIQAADVLLQRGICRLTLLGDPGEIESRAAALGVDLGAATLVDPAASPLLPRFAREYAELRKHKLVPYDQALDHCSDPSYFGTMMVLDGLADGMVSGSVNTTAHTIRPALEVIKTAPGAGVVSSVFFMCLPDNVLVYGDCAVNPDPTAEQLADIAISSAGTAQQFGIPPRIAMLSYSTGSSGSGADVDKVRVATDLVRQRAPHLEVEGPIQYDAAVDPVVAQTKLRDSAVAGRATVLIFPDLNTGNNTYKAVQRSAAAVAIGPVLQGLRKPVNDLSRGALVTDIVNTVAITAIQASALPADS